MIGQALKFIESQLNDFIGKKTTPNRSMVKLSGLVTPDGVNTMGEKNKLVISVVNIAEEGILANHHHLKRQTEGFLKQSPAVHLNVYLLISALFKEDDYDIGLSWLSLAISFFQQHAHFKSEHVKMPKSIDQLSFELVNLDIDNMSRFWGALGARYQPSVIYKMRMLTVESDAFDGVFQEFRKPEINMESV